MTLHEKQHRFLRALGLFLNFWTRHERISLTGGQLWRDQAMQDVYVKTGASKTKNSNHLNRLAIDLNIFYDGQYITSIPTDDTELRNLILVMGEEWENICRTLELAPEWGGRFGVDPGDYSRRIGWDFGHFGVKP